jgi:hypothetical protein
VVAALTDILIPDKRVFFRYGKSLFHALVKHTVSHIVVCAYQCVGTRQLAADVSVRVSASGIHPEIAEKHIPFIEGDTVLFEGTPAALHPLIRAIYVVVTGQDMDIPETVNVDEVVGDLLQVIFIACIICE